MSLHAIQVPDSAAVGRVERLFPIPYVTPSLTVPSDEDHTLHNPSAVGHHARMYGLGFIDPFHGLL